MIRIDEIYSGTIASWIDKHRPDLRLVYCDPFGRSDPDSVMVNDPKSSDADYALFFDQEPINYERHKKTFDKVLILNIPGKFKLVDHLDDGPGKTKLLEYRQQQPENKIKDFDIFFKQYPEVFEEFKKINKNQSGHLVVSEKNSVTVDLVCNEYKWKQHYYFFHGWATLDWYRGYNRTNLITDPSARCITRTFIAPNRIVAGERQHRLLMLYHIFKNNLINNWISCPAVCPAENITVQDAAKDLAGVYPDIEKVFNAQSLPMDFPGESGHPMTSCWLDLFKESADCLLYLVTETVATGQRLHLTEKTFKPICLQMPFVIVGTQGSLAYLRSYGFRTFDGIWDESYDDEPDDILRIERIASLLRSLDELSIESKQDLFDQCRDVVEHNYRHFYSGAFEEILWQELQDMLNEF